MSASTERFTLATLAKFWAVSPRHVLRMVNDGRLQAINIGSGRLRKLVITREAVEAFERSCAVSVDPTAKPKARATKVKSFV